MIGYFIGFKKLFDRSANAEPFDQQNLITFFLLATELLMIMITYTSKTIHLVQTTLPKRHLTAATHMPQSNPYLKLLTFKLTEQFLQFPRASSLCSVSNTTPTFLNITHGMGEPTASQLTTEFFMNSIALFQHCGSSNNQNQSSKGTSANLASKSTMLKQRRCLRRK